MHVADYNQSKHHRQFNDAIDNKVFFLLGTAFQRRFDDWNGSKHWWLRLMLRLTRGHRASILQTLTTTLSFVGNRIYRRHILDWAKTDTHKSTWGDALRNIHTCLPFERFRQEEENSRKPTFLQDISPDKSFEQTPVNTPLHLHRSTPGTPCERFC
jgi:hypothetical protein